MLGNLIDDTGTEAPLISNLSPVTRCEITVPPFTSSKEKIEDSDVDVAEVQAVLKGTGGNGAQETNCKPCSCTKCENNKIGTWYSDTRTFSFGGCNALLKYNDKEYHAALPGFILQPGANYLLAKFEVQEVS